MERTKEGEVLGRAVSCYPDEDDPLGLRPVRYLVYVLVSGAIGDYACYAGYGSPEWVARHGEKVSFAHARAIFPTIDQSRYRD